MKIFVYKISFVDPDTGEVSALKGITYAADYVGAVKNIQLFYGVECIMQIDFLGLADEEPAVIDKAEFEFYLSDL